MKATKYTRLDIRFPVLEHSFSKPLETAAQLMRSKFRLDSLLPNYNITLDAKTNVFIPNDNDYDNNVISSMYDSSSKNIIAQVSNDLNNEDFRNSLEYLNSLFQHDIIKNNLSIQKTKNGYKLFITFKDSELKNLSFKLGEFGNNQPFDSRYSPELIRRNMEYLENHKDDVDQSIKDFTEDVKDKQIHEAASHLGINGQRVYFFGKTVVEALSYVPKLVDREYSEINVK